MKKTLAILLALALVFSTVTVAFAEETLPADAKIMKDLGILVGPKDTGVTLDYLKSTPTRIQAAIIFLNLKGELNKALAFQPTENFADAKDAAWAAPIMGYLKANKNLGWVGDGTNFKPNDALTAQAYYKVMLEALGYKANTAEVIGDFVWANVIEFAASKGLKTVATVTNFTVNDVATATVEALKANVAGSTTKTLAASLVDAKVLDAAKATAAGLFTPIPTALAVTDVTTTNLKTMKIDFNKEINKDTVTTSTVKVTKSGSTVVSALDVTADKKSIVVTYSTVAQSDTLTLTIDGVKSVAGDELKAYALAKVVTDTTVPEILGASVKNAKQIELSFNEPINYAKASYQVINDIKIDGASIIAKATPNHVNNTVVLDFPTALTAGAHTISVTNMVDYATYKALNKDYAISVVADTTAPIMTNAVAKNKTTVEVTFDEMLDVQGTFEVNGVAVTTVTPVTGSNGTKFELTGGFTTLDISAIVEVKVAYKDQKDAAGNTVSTKQTYTFKVADDTVLPTVAVAIGTGNKLTLTFSKSMDATVGAITIKDKDGVTIQTINAPYTFKADTNNTVLEITAAAAGIGNMDPANITVNVKNMKDGTIRANILPETNVTLAAGDTKKPTVANSFFAVNGTAADKSDDTVTFYFSEAVDSATATNLSNYVGDSLGSLASVTGAKVKAFAADGKSITITVPSFRDVKATETFTVYAIKDAAGNMSVTNSAITLIGGTTLATTAAESTDGTKVKVTFDTKIATIDPSALKVQKVSDSSDYAVFINVTLASDGLSATFTANKSLGTNPSLYKVVDNNASLIKNIYDVELTAGQSRVVADKVAPTVTVATGDAAGQIKLTFSETVKVADLATLKNDLIVRDKNGALVTLADGQFTLTLAGGAGAVGGFDKIVISGLTTTENYTVALIGRNVTDSATTPVIIKELAATTVAAK